MTDDAATRFYKTSHQTNVRLGTGNLAQDINDPRNRYFGAAREIIGRSPTSVLELGYGSIGSVQGIAALGDFAYEITDIVDRLGGHSLPRNVTHRTCNLDNDFPHADASIDLVVALMIVEHLYDPFHAISEITRVLKPGGCLVMNLPNIASIKCRLALLMGRMPVTSSQDWFEKKEWDGNHLHYFTINDVKRLCSLYGLRLNKIYPVGSSLNLKRLWPSLLCHEVTFVFEKPKI